MFQRRICRGFRSALALLMASRGVFKFCLSILDYIWFFFKVHPALLYLIGDKVEKRRYMDKNEVTSCPDVDIHVHKHHGHIDFWNCLYVRWSHKQRGETGSNAENSKSRRMKRNINMLNRLGRQYRILQQHGKACKELLQSGQSQRW